MQRLTGNLAALSDEMPGASRTMVWLKTGRAVDLPSMRSLPAGTIALGAIWPIAHVVDHVSLHLRDPIASPDGLAIEAFDGRDWVRVHQDLSVTLRSDGRSVVFRFEPVATTQMRVQLRDRQPLSVRCIEIRRYRPELVNGRITWPRRMISHDLADDLLSRSEEPSFEALARHGLSMPTWAMMGLKDLGQEQAVNWDGEIYTRSCRLAMSLGRSRDTLPAHRDTIRRTLADGYLPGVIVEARIGDIAVRQTSFTVFIDDAQRRAAVFVRYQLSNLGRKAFRGPLQIEVKSPTVLRMHDPPPPLPLKLELRDGTLYEGDTAFLVGLTAGRPGDGRNTLRFDLKIAPGATAVVEVALPQTDPTPQCADLLRKSGFASAMKRFRAYWRRTLAPLARVCLPEERLNNLYRAIITQILINAHGNIMPYGAMPGGYDMEFFGVEEGYAMLGLAFFGFVPDAQRYMDDTYLTKAFLAKVEKFMGWQHRHQQYRNGLQPTYAVDLFRLGRDRVWMRKHLQLLKTCADWTIANRRKTKKAKKGESRLTRGLLPKWTFGGDIADKQCHGFLANFTCWRGLKDTAWVCGQLGDPKQARMYAHEAGDYRRCLLRAVDGAYRTDLNPPMLPLAVNPGVTTGGEYYQLFAGMILDQLPFEFADKRSSYLGDFLEQDNRTFLGLARFRVEQATVDAPHTVPGMLDAIYSMGHLLTRLHQGRIREFLLGFYAYQVFNLEHNCFGSRESNPIYASDYHLRTQYKTSEVTDPLPCSSAVALLLLRHMLVTEGTRGGGEFDGSLQLLWGAPRRWFRHGERLELKDMPTHFGPVSLLVQSSARNGLIRAEVIAPSREACQAIQLRLRHPDGRLMQRVTVNGKPHRQFDAAKELITLPRPKGRLRLQVSYE